MIEWEMVDRNQVQRQNKKSGREAEWKGGQRELWRQLRIVLRREKKEDDMMTGQSADVKNMKN